MLLYMALLAVYYSSSVFTFVVFFELYHVIYILHSTIKLWKADKMYAYSNNKLLQLLIKK